MDKHLYRQTDNLDHEADQAAKEQYTSRFGKLF